MGIVNNLIAKLTEKVTEKVVNQLEIKQSSVGGWGTLFAAANEAALFDTNLTKPYAQISTVYKAIKTIADNIPQAELAFYQYNSDQRIYPKEIIRLFDLPNPLMSGIDFLQALVGFFCLEGEAFIVKINKIKQLQNINALPAELWVFKPSEFTEILQPVDGKMQLTGWRYGGETFSLNEIIHITEFNPYNSIRGLSPLRSISKVIDLDWYSLIYNEAFFKNFATIGLTLTTDQILTEQQKQRALEIFEQRHSGVSKAFKIALFGKGIKPVRYDVSAKDMDYVEQRKQIHEDILGIWRVPKAVLNITENLNYATFIGQMKAFWIYTIEPMLRKIENAFNRGIIWPYDKNIYCRFDTSKVAAYTEDFRDKVQIAKILFDMGFTANEINEKLMLGFENKSWRDKWWIPFNLSPAETSAETSAENTENTENTSEEKNLQIKTDTQTLRNEIELKFLKRHDKLKEKFISSLRRFFYEQRKRMLIVLNKSSTKTINLEAFDWDFENQELAKRTAPYLFAAIQEGVDFAKDIISERISVDDTIVNEAVKRHLVEQSLKIKRVNETIKLQIAETIDESIRLGESSQQLAERIRKIYNLANNRATIIATTEMTSSLNAGSFIYYKQAKVKKKEWLTAGDEFVRDSHAAIDGQIVNIDQTFTNGLRYPGDIRGSAAEIINCRCTIEPIIER